MEELRDALSALLDLSHAELEALALELGTECSGDSSRGDMILAIVEAILDGC